MREKPGLWQGAERIQWGCVLMHMLGEHSLVHLHMVLSGLRSIERTQQTGPYAQAIQTARIILGDLITRHAVQNAVYEFQHAQSRSFTIDSNPKSLAFTSIYPEHLDSNIGRAITILSEELPRKPYHLELADPNRDLVVEVRPKHYVPIRLHGLPVIPPRKHDRIVRPRQPLIVSMSELRTLAEQLDADDQRAGRKSQDWSNRIKFLLQKTSGSGLRETDELDLSGLKHLIGLPGAGKSSLLSLLCILLGRKGLRIAVFFASIEVARDYLETLRRYEVPVALLVGRSGQTHRRHANHMAELIAGQGDGGFGHTRVGADLFAVSCPLPAFASEWPQDWSLGDAPCESLLDATDRETRRLCPAWELCGRVKNQRDLVRANVWLGHAISADTMVPAHTSDEQLRYFELIAETFDLAIFDECDETQKVLDSHGALTLELTGNETSLHQMIQDLTSLLATNRATITDGLLQYLLQANEFVRHMLRFLGEIRGLDRVNEYLTNEYADTLLTATFLLREACVAAGVEHTITSQMRTALSDLWERALYRAFFYRAEDNDSWPKAKTHASALGMTPEEANASWQRLNRALKRYLALEHEAAADPIIDMISEELAWLINAPTVEAIRDQVRLLITVGFTIASYQRLARSARPLAQRGEIPEKFVFAKASAELREIVPRSLLGTFSGVRYRRTPERGGFEFDYLVMDTTPRLLPHRLHESGRVNVLLTSATSWMEPATTYHVDVRPQYVISPKTQDVGDVRLYIHSKPHPVTRRPLRFSGAGREREHNLRAMVSALAYPEYDDLSELDKAVRAMLTPLGRRRKAVLVVNSYEQVRLVVEQIHDVHPALGDRTRGVVTQIPAHNLGLRRPRYVLKGHVEALGTDEDVDLLVFPIGALGRGVNIVFQTNDADHGRAAIGSIYFLTRPHPAAGDLSLVISLLARATHKMDQRNLLTLPLSEVQQIYDLERYESYREVANLLARPMSASALADHVLVNFAANQLVPILQTIGRGMRKRMPVNVYFVDAAWAPRSAEDQSETMRSSLLMIMQKILLESVTHHDPDLRDIYQALYGGFHEAFQNITGLNPPDGTTPIVSTGFLPSAATSEADFDDFELDDEVTIPIDTMDDVEEFE